MQALYSLRDAQKIKGGADEIETVVAKKYAKSFLNVTGGKASPKESYQKVFDAIKELFEIKDSHAVLNSYSMPRALKQELLDLALKRGKAPVELKEFVFFLSKGEKGFYLRSYLAMESFLRESQGKIAAIALSSHALSTEESKLISQSPCS